MAFRLSLGNSLEKLWAYRRQVCEAKFQTAARGLQSLDKLRDHSRGAVHPLNSDRILAPSILTGLLAYGSFLLSPAHRNDLVNVAGCKVNFTLTHNLVLKAR